MHAPETTNRCPPGQAPTVLIADDAQAVRGVFRVILVEHGYQVLEAENGYEAVALYAHHRPNVVLLDINMPRLDGLGALVQIKALDPHARVIMVTAQGERGKVMAAIRAGAQDYVVKPFQVQRVLSAIGTLLTKEPRSGR